MYDASFVQMASNLIKENKKKEAASVIDSGLEYFSKGLVEAITPYAAADAGLIVMVCRHLAQELERKNSGAKELADWLEEHTKKPEIEEKQFALIQRIKEDKDGGK